MNKGFSNFSQSDVGTTYRLKKAILVYSGGYASIHDVAMVNDAPCIKSGAPLSHSTLFSIINQVSQSAQVGTFLPENVLSVGLDSLVWWVPPTSRKVFFKCDKGDDKLIVDEEAVVPHPGLVFVATSKRWAVFSVKGTRRPKANTLLYKSPYFNTWDSGRICVGTAKTPESVSAKNIGEWEDAFFNSAFSHPNPNSKQVKYTGGIWKLWRDLLDGVYSKFPSKVLNKQGMTVEELIEIINKGKGF